MVAWWLGGEDWPAFVLIIAEGWCHTSSRRVLEGSRRSDISAVGVRRRGEPGDDGGCVCAWPFRIVLRAFHFVQSVSNVGDVALRCGFVDLSPCGGMTATL